MKNKLQNYFPMIRTKGQVLEEIRNSPKMWKTFCGWEEKYQQEYLDICTGVKGVKLLYDTYFKVIMNPDTRPERLNDFLSEILGRKIRILKVLPNESARIAAESSLLIMDIVVQFEDGSIANVEVQKMGYLFPGQRSACYSSDLLLRQYKRVKGEKKKAFSYKDIKSVYTIVFFETSIKEFHEYPQNYIHKFKQQSDTGLELELLQKYVFIPLDIFRGIYHNNLRNKTEAWLTFLSTDEPEIIIELIRQYPEFKEMYEEIYVMCQNVEKVMEMFSKELIQLDRNTVQYMIDEMQDTIDVQKETIDTQKVELEAKHETINTQKEELETARCQLQEMAEKLRQLEKAEK